MRDQMEQRLSELRKELMAGQQLLNDLSGKQQNVQRMLFRISGAIQVLEELLQTENNSSLEQQSSVSTDGVAASAHAA